MNIVIVANFCLDFSADDNGRFSYLANMFSENNKVELITSNFYHITKSRRTKTAYSISYKITMLHEPAYHKNVSLRRFYSHYIWGKNVEKYMRKKEKPDVIYCAVPSLTAAYKLAKYCKKNCVKFVIDIQDLWPEAFQMVLNLPIISKIVFFPLKKMADKIYSTADIICGVSKTYVDRALRVNRKCKEGKVVFLGTELCRFDQYAKRDIGRKKKINEFWLGYCGTLGSSYDLTTVFDALEILKKENKFKIKFWIMGDGPKADEFKSYASKKEIDVYFLGRLPYEIMCAWITHCDIAINPIMHNAAQSIINKHADYAAAGIPVISTQENQEYRDLVDKYSMGFNCRNNDAVDMGKKIKLLLENDSLRKKMGSNARKCAMECFDRKKTYLKLTDL